MELTIDGIIFALVAMAIIFLIFLILMKYEQKKLGYKTFKEYLNASFQQSRERNCKHEEWNHDSQIKIIECCKCGKRAKVKEYKSLFDN